MFQREARLDFKGHFLLHFKVKTISLKNSYLKSKMSHAGIRKVSLTESVTVLRICLMKQDD